MCPSYILQKVFNIQISDDCSKSKLGKSKPRTCSKEQMSNPQAQSHRGATVSPKKQESKDVSTFFKLLSILKLLLNS
jgi:hypothetical protein